MPVLLPERPNICSVCHQKAFGYNYDVVSCNACKMFFRRANTEKIDERCKKDNLCFTGEDLWKIRPRCRPCRYRKCIDLGMRHQKSDSESPSSGSSESSRKNSMVVVVQKPIVTQVHIDSRLLQQITYLNNVRSDIYGVINVLEDPSFIDLVARDPQLGIYKRPDNIVWEDTARKLKPWGSLGVLLVAEVIKTMDFYNHLLLSDRVILLRNVAFKSHHLCIAFDSYSKKKGRVLAPNGGEMFPAVLFEIPKCRDIIMDLLTTPMKPLQDLKLTENEFLLLNMIVICNPGLADLSLHGQGILSDIQTQCGKILFQLCMRDDSINGPMRYMNILAVDNVLTRQRYVTDNVVKTLQDKWNPGFHFSKVLTESYYIPNLSPTAREILDKQRKLYFEVLLRQCLISNPRSAPGRFMEVLRAVMCLDVQAYTTRKLLKSFNDFWKPNFHVPNVFKESCDMEGIEGLSLDGQAILSSYQRMAARMLLHLCMLDNPITGPNRFGTILPVSPYMNKQIGTTNKMNDALCEMGMPFYIPKVLSESCFMEKEVPEGKQEDYRGLVKTN